MYDAIADEAVENGEMISVESLTKCYGSTPVLDNISFKVCEGSVTGLLGPNGAGKSTAMRIIAGLTSATSGRATVLGREYRDLPTPGRLVGVMLDASAQHPGRTGIETLRITALHLGLSFDHAEIARRQVGLTSKEGRRRVRDYSLGMRQRLGLASALMGKPRVLILDEPVNGLDPQGIHWMRGLLRDFADAGGAILLSSHVLGEIEVVADRLVVIGSGRVVAQGETSELLGARGTRVRSEEDSRLAASLRGRGYSVVDERTGLAVAAPPEVVGRVVRDEQIVVLDMRGGGSGGIEEMFLEMTSATSREEVAS